MKLNLKNRILVPTLGIIFLTAIAISLTSFIVGKTALEESISSQMKGITASTIHHIEDWFTSKKLDLEQMATGKEYLSVLQDTTTNSGSMEAVNAGFRSIK